MSLRTRITRDQWLAAMGGLLTEGVIPADMPLSDLCQRLGVTKGSFYSHFPGGVEELHREIIGRWLRETDATGLATPMRAIRDPRDRLRLLRARALETAQRDGAMRRWAARDPAAAAAVAQADAEVITHVTKAVGDLGLPAEGAAVMAEVLVHAFAGAHHSSPAPQPSSPARFETLLEILTWAASGQSAQERGGVEVAAGSVPDEVVLFTIAEGLPAEARRDLRDQAQRFAEQASAQGKPAARSRPAAPAEPRHVRRSTGA
jgi:AcrR family transcriptional regulator